MSEPKDGLDEFVRHVVKNYVVEHAARLTERLIVLSYGAARDQGLDPVDAECEAFALLADEVAGELDIEDDNEWQLEIVADVLEEEI